LGLPRHETKFGHYLILSYLLHYYATIFIFVLLQTEISNMTRPERFLESFKILVTEETVVHKGRKGRLMPAHEQIGKVKIFNTFFEF